MVLMVLPGAMVRGEEAEKATAPVKRTQPAPATQEAATGEAKAEQDKPLLGHHPAMLWTGKEVLLWDGANGFALDPAKDAWRRMGSNPRAGKGIYQPKLLDLGGGKILATYWQTKGPHALCFDHYIGETDTWRSIAAVPRGRLSKFEDFTITFDGKKETVFALDLECVVKLSKGVVVFVGPRQAFAKVIGVQLTPEGKTRLISSKNAPQRAGRDVAAYASGGKVLYWGYAHVAYNHWSVWDEKTDAWQKPQEFDRAYSFGHCFTGEEVYIIGGAESSAFGWLKKGGWVYSFKKNKWRRLHWKKGLPLRRDFAMCWTGKEVLVWGGETAPEEAARVGTPFYGRTNTGNAFDPSRQRWTPIPTKNAPSPRSWCQCVWTGKEMIVWGGYLRFDAKADRSVYANDGGAYNPRERTWRKLPDLAQFVRKGSPALPKAEALKSQIRRGGKIQTDRSR